MTLLARRSLFGQVGPFNTDLLGDPLEWFMRVAEKGAIMELLPEVLVYRRMHQTNLSMEPDALLQVVKASLDRRRRTETGPVPLKFPEFESER